MKRTLALFTVLVLPGFIGPAAAERPMTPEDLYAIQRVSDPRVSPDGKWIAFVVAVPDLEENQLDSDVWLMPLDGGKPRKLTSGPKTDDSPRWSPNGKQLAFISDRNGTEDLYLINVRRGEARQLTSSDTDLVDPLWSRDGKSILCGSRVLPQGKATGENRTEEELPKCKARTIDRLLFRQWDEWLGDERNHLFLVSVKDGSMEELTPGEFDTPPVSLASDHDFDLSPDGDQLCFVRNDDPDSATSTNHDLYLLDRRTSQMRKLTDNPARDSQPHYSPDGRYIAYSAMSTPGYESDRQGLVIYDRTSGDHLRLTDGLDRSVREILWHPNSRELFFTARDQGRLAIFRVDLEGRIKKLSGEGYSRDLAVSPDGGVLVFRRSYNHLPEELFSLSVADGKTAQLTSFNAELLEEISLSPLEEFWFTGADNTRVHGFLQRPPGFDPGKKYPAVLVIHGGPQGMWADRFMTTWFTFPLISSPGYVGVFINPRGSSGYGLEFQAQVSRDYGGRCYEDLMKGLDYAIEHYEFIDSKRLAAVGGSFGGYSVNWIIGQTDRFRAAVSHAGLFNLTSFYGATEELWFPAWDMGETPWDEPELYARWSPHHHVKRFKTPTLVTHGERDYRVPFAESLQLFTALQRRKVPSRLVVFPDDGHVIESPQSNVRWWKEIHRWLKEWLE